MPSKRHASPEIGSRSGGVVGASLPGAVGRPAIGPDATENPAAANSGATASHRLPVLGIPIDALSWDETTERITGWVRRRESRTVAVCNVHSIVTSRWDPAHEQAIKGADITLPDGMPLAWVMRGGGARGQARINGPDLMVRLCDWAARHDEPVFLYGTTPDTLRRLRERLAERFTSLRVAGTLAPPFRELTEAEDARVIERINASGAGLVFVALGCPKQEKWVDAHRGRVNAVMIGVGVAFDYHAGNVRRAPVWMQRAGLEWAYRLGTEPRRLWRRYLVTNTVFIARLVGGAFRGRR